MIAHIVAPGFPWFASWLASVAMFAGVVVALVWWRLRTRRRIGIALAAAGVVGNAVLLGLQPSVPVSPGYGISVAAAEQAASPVPVRVCGVATDSSAAAVPGADRLLLLLVDGRQVAEVRSDVVAVPMSTGRHRITAELITADHRAFVPPVTAEAMVTVSGPGALSVAPPCGP